MGNVQLILQNQTGAAAFGQAVVLSSIALLLGVIGQNRKL